MRQLLWYIYDLFIILRGKLWDLKWWILGFRPELVIGENGQSIKQTRPRQCARCNHTITKDNDSGWSEFTSATATQPVCASCWGKCRQCGQPLPLKRYHLDSDFRKWPEYLSCPTCPPEYMKVVD